MELIDVRLEAPANTPMVLLREAEGRRRVLPILIGLAEANAIQIGLEGVVPPRPLTHDLAVSIVSSLGGTLDRVVVTEVRDHTFFAELRVTTATGEQTISSRPSDAIAIAVRLDTPIFAEEALLDEAALEVAEDDADPEAILDEFRDFLDDVSPEDFAG